MTPLQVNHQNNFILFVFLVLYPQNVIPDKLPSFSYITVPHCCLRDETGNCSEGSTSFNNNSYTEYFDLPEHLLMPHFSNTSIRFGLSTSSEDEGCKSANGEVEVNVLLARRENGTDDNSSEKKFTPDGFFKFGNDYFSTQEYCVKSLLKEHLVLSLCLPDCDINRPCLTRCCEFGQVLDFSHKIQCTSSGDKQWVPTVYKTPTVKLTEDETKKLKFHFVSNNTKTWCSREHATIYSFNNYLYFEKSLFRILKDGSVVQKDSKRRWKTLSEGTYCVEGIQNVPGSIQQHYSGEESQTIIFDCEKPKELKETSTSIIYGIAQIISCIFLLTTVVVYGLLWDKQNIHGWTLLGYVTSMFFLYIMFVTTYFYIYIFNKYLPSTMTAPLTCKYLAIATHFLFLATFCWMTLINFDLYITFKNLKPTAGNSKRKKRFFVYALFALGLPLLVVSIGIILDYLYGEDIESEVIVPQYGKFKCSLDLEYAALPYLYGPISFLLICNLLFFVTTVYSMYRIQQTTKIATTNSSQRPSQRNKQKTLLFLKILSVMGIQWISEVVTWAFFGNDSTHIAVVILDVINILQPIAIFVIFVCKADICNSLRQKYRLIDRTATSLSIDTLTADRIVHRWPKLERVIGPITRKEEDRRRRCLSTTTELTNLSVRQTSVGQIQLHEL